MEKPAATAHQIEDLLRRRWSPLAFADRAIEPWKLASLTEAARWAPSSFNEQPWAFVFCPREQQDAFERAAECLVDANARWATGAPLLGLSVAKLRFERNDKENRHALHDVGLAMGNMLVQATALGLAVHQMAGFDPDKARAAFAIPTGWEPVAMMALGYQGSIDDLPEDLQQRERSERTRKPLSEFVFTGQWGHTAEFLK